VVLLGCKVFFRREWWLTGKGGGEELRNKMGRLGLARANLDCLTIQDLGWEVLMGWQVSSVFGMVVWVVRSLGRSVGYLGVLGHMRGDPL